MDCGFKSSTTLSAVFCEAEVLLKEENWDLNLKTKHPEESQHGGEDWGICNYLLGNLYSLKNPNLSSSYALVS